jgi:site-specific recombinase XerD
MDKWYNFYNFEASFKKFLLAENVSPITLKSYLSDLRHFLGWTILKLKAQNKKNFENLSSLEFLNQIDESLVEEYKNYLVVNAIPAKTINRRLSTLRKFFSFCISQGWLKENPAKKIQNLKLNIDSIISSFALSLEKENLDQKTIKSYLEVVQEFLSL